MRYQESRDKSAELVRLILPRIAQNGGHYHPTIFTVWYEYLADINPPLKLAIDARLARPDPPTSDETVRLFARHIGARRIEAAEKLQADIGTLLRRLGTLAEDAGAGAAEFSSGLADVAAHLDETLDPEGFKNLIRNLAARTASAKASADTMRQAVENDTQELAILRDRLEKVQGEALTDALTKLRNRRGFEQAAESLIAGRPAGLNGCAVILADIDHFKSVNDTYGHLLGDQVICAVAQLLISNVKECDVAARIGGEEFAILLPDTNAATVLEIAERIRSTVGRARMKHATKNVHIGRVTLSLGTACGEQGESLESLVDRADQALYSAKRSGRDRVEFAAMNAK